MSADKKYSPVTRAWVDPFTEAAAEVLSTMAGITCESTDVIVGETAHFRGEISGVIGFLSEHKEGFVGITFEDGLAEEIVAKMIGKSSGKLNEEDVNDGVGEVVNMVVGKAKTFLSMDGNRLEVALPTVVRGPQHEITHKTADSALSIFFKTGDGKRFLLQISMRD